MSFVTYTLQQNDQRIIFLIWRKKNIGHKNKLKKRKEIFLSNIIFEYDDVVLKLDNHIRRKKEKKESLWSATIKFQSTKSDQLSLSLLLHSYNAYTFINSMELYSVDGWRETFLLVYLE